ncbi:DUF4917 family protein [Legionella gresilensis]|uniref:DUF4917 family protein n=1 Tax=Legionella gresilensis TaxID=91823 RepID=UPI00104111A4|nr:DUF4917 family protein [Legionella gresilensis]
MNGKERGPSLILGNGFNLALAKCLEGKDLHINLSYQEIKAEVIDRLKKEQESHTDLCNFLEQTNLEEKTDDLEYLLFILRNAQACIKYSEGTYCKKNEEKDYNELIPQDIKLLKEFVINVLTDSNFHPQYDEIINFDNDIYLKTCAENILQFDKLFTTNYDLILYWILNSQGLTAATDHKKGKFRDGFSARNNYGLSKDGYSFGKLYGINSNNPQQNVCFLHGAIHLLQYQHKTYKIVKEKNKALTLQDIRKILIPENSSTELSDFENLIVFDATSYDKIQDIYNDAYLEKSYDKLISINGDTVIYGCHILSSNTVKLGNDAHLWRRLVNSKTKKIYAGICPQKGKSIDSYAKELQKELISFRCSSEDINLYCYSQNDINIWENPNFFAAIVESSSKGYSIKPRN